MPRILNLSNFQTFQAIDLSADPGHDPGAVTIPNAVTISVGWVTASLKGAKMIWHASYTGAFHGSQTEANAILTALTTGGNWTAFAAFVNNQAGISGVSIRNISLADQPIISSNIAGVLGTSASPALPDEVAAVVTLRTGATGQANRGRTYVPGWATNALGTGNVIAAAAVTALNNWASTWAGALSAQGYILGVGHFHRNAYISPVTGRDFPERPAGMVPITNVTVRDNHWDTQRRRGLK